MEVRHNAEQQRFEAGEADRLALLVYRERDGVLRLVHTEVPEALAGGGMGGSLVRSAFEYARERGLKVQPLCSFAAAWSKRHPEYADVLVSSPGADRGE